MNEEIKSILENSFNINFEVIKSSSIEKMIDTLIKDESETVVINLDGSVTKGFNDNEITNLISSKKNSELISAFESAKKMRFNENEIIPELKIDIINSISEINTKLILKIKDSKIK